MTSRNSLIGLGVVLQIGMVVAGHFHAGILGLSGILGVGIPLVLGCLYGLRTARSTRDSLLGGFLIGLVGAVVGILVAILLGDQPWLLLTFGPLSSAIAAALGAWCCFAIQNKRS